MLLQKWAHLLVNYSLEVQKGERILITGHVATQPLFRACYEEVLKAGGIPITQVELSELEPILYKEGSKEQIEDVAHTTWLYEHVDGCIKILGNDNLKELSGSNPEKMQWRRKANLPVLERMIQGKIRWVLTLFPTNAQAQEAGMSLSDYTEFVQQGVLQDYVKLKNEMTPIAAHFNQAKKVRIVGKRTDVTIDIEDREAVLCTGTRNVPDGEFYFTPNHLKTQGEIYYEWPIIYNSQEINGIYLKFEEGKVVNFSAEKGQELLTAVLNTDPGAVFLGELGIGMNQGIKQFTKDILFDEKIGGTIHLALGQAYEKPGNQSAIHWDMVKDLRKQGEIYLDNKLVFQNGEWKI